jgi:SAM-dependent methyltransferase
MTRERRLAFGDVAELYDQTRPSYPSALVDDVLEFSGAEGHGRALEVGAGTGKATALFAPRGITIVALEPSRAMADVARRNCASYDNVTIEESEFEHWDGRGGEFELVFSAQAWHWISPDFRYVRAREALADGGALAVFWNRPRWETCAIKDDLADAYRRAAPELGAGDAGPGPMHPAVLAPPVWWGDWSAELRAASGFETPDVRSYPWIQVYSTDEYVQVLRTHSDHIVLADERREALLAAVAEVIERHGGALALEYVTALWLARAAGRA